MLKDLRKFVWHKKKINFLQYVLDLTNESGSRPNIKKRNLNEEKKKVSSQLLLTSSWAVAYDAHIFASQPKCESTRPAEKSSLPNLIGRK